MRIGSLRSPHIVVAASMIKDPAPCWWLLRPSGRVARQHFRINEVTRTVSRCRRQPSAYSDVDQRFFSFAIFHQRCILLRAGGAAAAPGGRQAGRVARPARLRPDDRPKPALVRGDRNAEWSCPDDKNLGIKRGKLPTRLGRATSAHYAYAPTLL